jgi:alkanesulfonate monooxygenase SsuD/methylene tetrahydromethanopterin reductase-like flavin-dependent oxidoreductase (luciferase family)
LGRPFDTIRTSVLLGATVGHSAADVEQRSAAALEFFGVGDAKAWREHFADSWTYGTPTDLAARLKEYSDVGVDHVMLMLGPGDDMEMISLVAEEVFPLVGHRAVA